MKLKHYIQNIAYIITQYFKTKNKKLAILVLSIFFIIALSSLIIATKPQEDEISKIIINKSANNTIKEADLKKYAEDRGLTFIKDNKEDLKLKNKNLVSIKVMKNNKTYTLIIKRDKIK